MGRGRFTNRHRMRCSKCHWRSRREPWHHGRFTLPRHPDKYVRPIKCPNKACRSTKVYSCEASRRREQLKHDTCICDGYWFPHQSGTIRFCENHPSMIAGIQPTQDEIDFYESSLLDRQRGKLDVW